MSARKVGAAVALVAGLGVSGAAQATLIPRAAGMVYDDVLEITWAPADLFGPASPGWDEAVAWADSLVYGGFSDWRLASMSVAGGLPSGATDSVVDCSAGTEEACRDNELGYMFYWNLGGTPGADLSGDQGPFTGIRGFYWSGTAYASDPIDVWAFGFRDGNQSTYSTLLSARS